MLFIAMCGWRKWFPVMVTASALLASVACRRDGERSLSFVGSLRCGMTRAEITRLAHEHGYDGSDKSWLARSAITESMKSKELSLVDLRFRGGRLVGLREGRYEPGTKRVEYHNLELCKP